MQTHFLIYRVSTLSARTIDWDTPTGGLVMHTLDASMVRDVANQRYHCGPNEELIIAEVWEANDKFKAELLSVQWEGEATWFDELMKA